MAQIQVSVIKCDLCEHSDSQFFCYECQHALRDVCRKKHDKIPALKEHTSTDIQNVDLSSFNKKLQCETHEKEFVFHCKECKCLICYKCLRSTHKDHEFTDVDELVSEERQKLTNLIAEAKEKMNLLSEMKEKVKTDHLTSLQNKAKETIEEIESVFQELTKFLRSKKEVKVTEIEDFQTLESEELQSFIRNIEEVLTKCTRINLDMDNLLSEKHNVTFHLRYTTLKMDMESQDRIPEEPKLKKCPSFDVKMFYKEIVNLANSKFEDRLCENCNSLTKDVDQLVTENAQVKKASERFKHEIKDLKKEVENLKEKGENEGKRYKEEIENLKVENRNLQEKNQAEEKRHEDEIKKLQEEIGHLKGSKRKGRRSYIRPPPRLGKDLENYRSPTSPPQTLKDLENYRSPPSPPQTLEDLENYRSTPPPPPTLKDLENYRSPPSPPQTLKNPASGGFGETFRDQQDFIGVGNNQKKHPASGGFGDSFRKCLACGEENSLFHQILCNGKKS